VKQTLADKIFDVVNVIMITIITLFCAYPIYFALIASFSSSRAVGLGRTVLWVQEFTLSSYRLVLNYNDFWQSYGLSIIYTVSGILFNLLLTIPTAYVLTKKELPGRHIINWFFLFTMYFEGGLIPTYVTMNSLNLVNKPIILILLGGMTIYNLLVTRIFLEGNIPEEIFEAARLDGASEFRQFTQIVLPLSKAVIAVMCLYYGVDRWNNYFNALIYINNPELMPLQVKLRDILILNDKNLVLKYAVIFVSCAPLLIAYPFVQKYFTQGLLVGAVKS